MTYPVGTAPQALHIEPYRALMYLIDASICL